MILVQACKRSEKTNEVRSDWLHTQGISKFKKRTCYDVYLYDTDAPIDESDPVNRLSTGDGVRFFNVQKRFYKKSEMKKFIKTLAISEFPLYNNWNDKVIERVVLK